MMKENTYYYQHIHLDLGLIALLVLSLLGYSYYSFSRMFHTYTPLVEAIEHIKLNTTTAHLWLEEILSGDRYENISEVRQQLDNSDLSIKAILGDEGSNEGTIIHVDDIDLRQDFQQLREKLTTFRELTDERFESHGHDSTAAGTEIDQRYDGLFPEFIYLANGIDKKAKENIAQEVKVHRIIEGTLTFITVFLFVLAGIFF